MNRKPYTITINRQTGTAILVAVLLLPMLLQAFHRLWHDHEHPHFVKLTHSRSLHEHILPCPINDYQVSQFNAPDMVDQGIQQELLVTFIQKPHPRHSEVGFHVGYLLRAPPATILLFNQ